MILYKIRLIIILYKTLIREKKVNSKNNQNIKKESYAKETITTK